MPTDLFAAVGDAGLSGLNLVIPPACRRTVDAAYVTLDHGTAVLESPTWTPRHSARHLVPSFSLLDSTPCGFRFEVSGRAAGSWTPWVATATIGPAVFDDALPSIEALLADIDMYRASSPLECVRLRVRMQPARALSNPWLMTLSTSDLAPARPAPGSASRLAVPPLNVPPLSQMDEEPAIRDRICSPTCVAMVLAFWDRRAAVAEIAGEVFHAGLDRYGIWPAAIRAAGRRGIAGYLLRFPDWAAAAWCLEQGLPIIASIRFEPGELEGAPLARTDGHLVVVTGGDGDHVLVNDPVASRSEVSRRYRREQFCRVWLERSGVGYVLFPP